MPAPRHYPDCPNCDIKMRKEYDEQHGDVTIYHWRCRNCHNETTTKEEH